jgi:hypothetical protein
MEKDHKKTTETMSHRTDNTKRTPNSKALNDEAQLNPSRCQPLARERKLDPSNDPTYLVRKKCSE